MKLLRTMFINQTLCNRGLASHCIEWTVHKLHGTLGYAVSVHVTSHNVVRTLLLAWNNLERTSRIMLLQMTRTESSITPLIVANDRSEAAIMEVVRKFFQRVELHAAMEPAGEAAEEIPLLNSKVIHKSGNYVKGPWLTQEGTTRPPCEPLLCHKGHNGTWDQLSLSLLQSCRAQGPPLLWELPSLITPADSSNVRYEKM
ncbi:TNF receptor-associated factor family protein [Senna tora]|uniref:TNF receptor-associated factor family protein n=1 Tax=Senna tora TaxID=362788 RepID=A0A834TBF8_9FABA|nr:TNF receptor-associated factor family protein [Senna tora]